MLLENFIELFDETKLNEELDVFAEALSLYERTNIEPVKGDSSYSELLDLMGDAIMKFTAARKGIGLANKLSDPAERKKHKSAVLGNMNRLRGLMSRLDKAMAKVSSSEGVNEDAKPKGDAEDSFKQFDKMAQAVWKAKDVESKKAELNKMIGAFKYKDKQQKFYDKVKAETNPNKLDKLAADIMQVGHGNAVIK